MEILTTPRLLLRDFCLDDLDELYRLVYADPRVKDTWSGVTGTPEQIKERFANRHILPAGPFGFKAVVLSETGALIGLMGFQIYEREEGEDIAYLLTPSAPHRQVNFDPDCLEVELTYALGHEYWKHGYALEMGQAMVAYSFQTLGIGRIIQGVLASNTNSIQLMRRLGFRVEAGLKPNTIVGILEKTA
jgi:[ribosomal protein S5]-alanine N-acetyltransferase